MDASGSNRIRSIRIGSGAILLAVGLVAIQLPIAFAATSVESVEGSAYGAFASVDLALVDGTLGPVPSVALPAEGGEVTETQASSELTLSLTEIVDLGGLEVSSTGSGIGGSDGQVVSVALVADTEILGGLIEADQVTASCSADSSGAQGQVTLTGASAAGIGTLTVSPVPNTGITVPGVGDLVLNKQTTSSDGTLTVTGLSLTLLPVLGTGTIDIAGVTCGAEISTSSTPTTAAPPPPTTGSPSTTDPGLTTTTTVSQLSPTTTPGEPTTTVPGAPTTTAAADDPTDVSGSPDGTTSSEDTASNQSTSDVTAAGDTTSDGTASEDFTLDGTTPQGTGSHDDTPAAGLIFDRTGGPPASGEATVASGATSDADGPSSPWLTLVDYAILAILGGSAALIGWTKLDIRRLIRGHWLAKRGP